MEKVEKSPKDDFFSRRLEGSETPFYTVRIHGYWGKAHYPAPSRYLDFPEEIVSAMQLKLANSVSWKREGDSLVMTPLSETVITTKVSEASKLYTGAHYFAVSLPLNMMLTSGLKFGDYIRLRVEDDCLRVRKVEGAGQDAVKIIKTGSTGRINIPVVVAEELKLDSEKVKKGVWMLLRFDEKGVFGEFQNQNPYTRTILPYNKEGTVQLTVSIPSELGEGIRINDDVVLQMRNRKLYVTKKKA